jgi:dCTP deaminase
MLADKQREHGVSYGLAEAGYDIRIKQDIVFYPADNQLTVDGEWVKGRFTIASALEEFTLPDDLVGVVHDKSTWARKGLSVFNTVLEPKWQGFLTLELVYHGGETLHIPAGAGIAQVLFHKIENTAAYSGKYQNQADAPVAAKFE